MRKSRCWPIDRDFEPLPLPSCNVSDNVSANEIRASDTPGRLRALSRRVEDIIRSKLDFDEKEWVFELIDFAGEKVAKHRDIAPRADTLSRLRDGKVRRTKKGKKRVGEARILTHKYVNDGIKKVAEEEAKKLARQQALAEKKRIADERKAIRDALEKQWKADLKRYTEVVIPTWQAECTEIDTAWAATKQATGKKRSTGMKRPPYPPRPKRPLKPKGGGVTAGDLSMVVENEVEEEVEGEADGEGEGQVDEDVDEEDLVDSMRNLEIDHFAAVSAPTYCPAIRSYHSLLLPN
ncbi:hypothetical protein L211DRAFT_853423 [Terfezia boudieri ATCC MYA-4762]|uniref:Uncharacterized protein n=1 Tax=Terfezia boudieri ATCC MYA-4762 TaxID=1051890 RepID=A0A3N4LCP0_9PEZI|nr:hypothetical protein L211DRAFT_853423 [Terfezia boudieri ATCC MYA-4762]